MIDWDLISKDIVVIAKYYDYLSGNKNIVPFTIDGEWLHSDLCNVGCFIEKCSIIAIRPSAMIAVANAINTRLHDVINEDEET